MQHTQNNESVRLQRDYSERKYTRFYAWVGFLTIVALLALAIYTVGSWVIWANHYLAINNI